MITATVSATEPPDAHHARIRLDKFGEPFVIREMTSDDRRALLAFYEDFEPKRTAQGLPPKGSERIQCWLDSVLSQGRHLLALRGTSLIGHALIIPTPRQAVAEYAVFLHQNERRKGVGTELNRESLDLAREAGFERLWLTVEPRNRAAIRSYEKVGFQFLPGTIVSLEAEMEIGL